MNVALWHTFTNMEAVSVAWFVHWLTAVQYCCVLWCNLVVCFLHVCCISGTEVLGGMGNLHTDVHSHTQFKKSRVWKPGWASGQHYASSCFSKK